MKKRTAFIMVFLFFLNFPAAASTCDKEKKLSNNAIIALQSAQKLRDTKELEKGAKVLNDFIKKNKKENHHFIEYLLGTIYLDLNQDKTALKAFEKSIGLCPDFTPSWQNIGKISYDLKDYEKAAFALEKSYYLSKKKDKNLLFAAAMANRSCKKINKCYELLDLITTPPAMVKNHVNAYVNIGIQLKKHDEVLNRLNKLIDLNKNSAFLLKLASNTALSLNDYKKAVNYLTIYSMVKKDTKFKEDKLTADLLRAVKAPFKAIKFYEKALTKKEDLKVYKSLISALIQTLEFDKGLMICEKALKKFPDAQGIWKLKGVIHYEKKAFTKAYDSISKSIKLKNRDRNSPILLAYCAGKSGKIEDAKKFFRKNKDLKPCKKALKILNSFEK